MGAALFFTSQSKLLWNYTDIAGCKVVLEPDSMLFDGSNHVYQWSDKSGNNNHYLNPNGVSQPLYVADGGPSVNNFPVCRFAGVKYLQAIFTLTQPVTYFIIYKLSAATSGQVIHDGVAGGGRNLLYYDTTTVRQYAGAEITYAKTAPYDFVLNTEIYNGASSKLYENGIIKKTGNTGAQSIYGAKIGLAQAGGYPMTGDIVAKVIYTGALSDTDRATVETFMINKYL